jgi:GT2 family glycosyltransferase
VKLIVPVLNRYDLLQRMVLSIDFPIEELLIIDNGNALEALQTNEHVNKLTILPMPSNQGVAGSWNLGIKCFPFEPVWFFSSADTVYQPGALEKLSKAKPDRITLTARFPHWQTFAIGEEVVRSIGLFDESIFPIYFEDNDYTRRAGIAGIETDRIEIEVDHDNSSTINSDAHYMNRNGSTFVSNMDYYNSKQPESEGRWDLDRRRKNEWAK